MHSVQKYLLIGPIALLIAFGVAVYVKRQAAKPRNPETQLIAAKQLELKLGADPSATKDEWLGCIAAYERVFTAWPKSREVVEAYAAIGRICKRRLKDPEQAFVWFSRVTDEFPDSETAEGVRSERKSLAYRYAGSTEKRPEFVAALSDYIEHNPGAFDLDKVLVDRGKAYLTLKQPDKAIADFERILAEFPKGSWADDAVFYIGDAYVMRGDEDKALEQYEKLISDYGSSNQIDVARKRTIRIWEKRLNARLDEFFKTRYGIDRATMFFNRPRPLYDVGSKDQADRVEAALAQTLDLDSAELTVEISGTTLVVSGSLVVKNPSVVEHDEDAGEKKAPTEAKTLWLDLNAGMELEGLTQGEATLELKRYKNLVEVTLAEPIAVDGATTLAFRVTNGGKNLPGIVISEAYGHALADAFWFPTLKLADAFTSTVTFKLADAGTLVSNGAGSLTAVSPGMRFEVSEPVAGRFFIYGLPDLHEATWGERRLVALTNRHPEAESVVTGFLDEAAKAAEYLEGVFGTYPYDKIVFAQSPDVKGRTFDYGAGLILINDEVPLDSIKPEQICNVLVQQWYGGLVYPISDDMLWYTAGVASYYETLYLKHRYGDEAMAAHWGELRALYDELFAHIPQRRLAFPGGDDSERVFGGLVYTKGAWFLRTLRYMAGDEAFVNAQRAFLEKNAFKPVTFRELRVEFDKAAGGEFEETFGAWLLGESAPSFTVEDWLSTPLDGAPPGEEFEISFKLTQPGKLKFVLPVEVAFEAGSQRVVHVARITKTTEGEGANKKDIWHETFRFSLPFDPERIVLDPDQHILFSPGAQRTWSRPQPVEKPADTP